jgi:hypothetical protein
MDDDSLGVEPPCEAGAVDHEYADSLIALLIYCEHTLSAVGETSNESVKLSGGRRLRLVVGIDIHREYDT